MCQNMEYMAHQSKKPTVQEPIPVPMTSGPRKETVDRKGRSVGPLGGQPTYWSADQAHGLHHLNFATWCSLTGPNVGFAEKSYDLRVAPSYKYKGRGRGMNTHTSHP